MMLPDHFRNSMVMMLELEMEGRAVGFILGWTKPEAFRGVGVHASAQSARNPLKWPKVSQKFDSNSVHELPKKH